jgi:2-haloacid dehalogenase
MSLAPLGDACDRLAPGRGADIAARWRARQLEATWLRTVMERWVDLDIVTRDALVATLDELDVEGRTDLDAIAAGFGDLPLVDGAAQAIRVLRDRGAAIGILTNASERTLGHAAGRLGALGLTFDHLLSVDRVRRFKPHPSVYRLAVDATGLPPERIGFVTANGWDAAGAGAVGLRVAWLRPGPSATLPAVGVLEPTIATWSTLTSILGRRRA